MDTNLSFKKCDMLMNCCDREIVDDVPDNSAPVSCGGKECNHQKVYLLQKEDCRQVVLKSDV